MTAWSLLGSHDWNRMVTRPVGHYEVGVFDVRSGTPRPTRLAPVLQSLAEGRAPEAVGLSQPGWWRRESRFGGEPETFDAARGGLRDAAEKPLMIVGSGGPLARLLSRACDLRGLPHLTVPRFTREALASRRPWAVIDARDWAGVCQEPRRASRRPGFFMPPEQLVGACAEQDVPCLVFSPGEGFEEVDDRLLEAGGGYLSIARTEHVYAPWERSRLAIRALESLETGSRIEADAETHWDEAYGPDVVDAALDLLLDGVTGVLNLQVEEPWTVAEFLRRMAEVAECDVGLVQLRSRPTLRPVRGGSPAQATAPCLLPPLESTLERLVREARCARRDAASVVRRFDEPRMQAAL